MSRSTRRSRGLRAGVAALVGLGAVALTAPAAQAASSLTITQIGGESRYATAAQASAASFPAGVTRTAVIASGNSTVDALASSFVAGANSAPILLVTRDSIPAETKAELARLGVQRVILAGGTSVISADVATQLSASYTVVRADGADRYETAAKLTALVSATPTTVFVASAPSDAAAISPIAAAKGWPILLTQPNAVPASTRQALAGYPGARVVVVGGTSAVTAQTATDLGSTVRLTGSDRFQTAVSAATFGIQSGFSATGFGLALGVNGADGNDLSDALTAGPILARTQSPLLLSAGPADIGTQTQTFLTQNAARFTTSAVVFGGASAVSPSVVSSAAAAVGTTATPTPPTPTAPTDTVAPVLRASLPLGSAVSVPVNVSPTATYDEYLGAGLTTAAIVRTDAPNTPIAASVSVVGSVVTLDPTSDLAPGVEYRVTVTASDISRNAAAPRQFTFTTAAAAPTLPTGLLSTITNASAGSATNGQLAVAWTASTANGSAITGYTVTLTSGPGGFSLPAAQTVTATTATFINLPVGSYTATVRADSAAGNSTPVAVSGTVAARPAAPSGVTGTPTSVTPSVGGSNGAVALSWTAPTTYGSAITGYTISASTTSPGATAPAPQTITSGTSANFTGLKAGTYNFSVVANSAAGNSIAGTGSAIVTQPAAVVTGVTFADGGTDGSFGTDDDDELVVTFDGDVSNLSFAGTTFSIDEDPSDPTAPRSFTIGASSAADLGFTVSGSVLTLTVNNEVNVTQSAAITSATSAFSSAAGQVDPTAVVIN